MYKDWKSYQKNLGKVSRTRFRITSIPSFRLTALSTLLATVIFLCLFFSFHTPNYAYNPVSLEKKDPSEVLKTVVSEFDPSDINSENIFSKTEDGEYFTRLSLNKGLQKTIEKLLKRYKPPYAAFVGLDPKTGKILAMASYSKVDSSETNWCLKSSFRAASIFKLVTSAAAIEKINLGRNSKIGFNGRLYRLNKRSVLDNRRYRNSMTLGDAFAKSVNIVFAKLISLGIESDDLKNYSDQFLFNHPIPFDLNVEESPANIPTEDYKLARTAAGFGDVHLSPLHGAVIVSAMLNSGTSVSPYIIEKIYDSDRTLVYEKAPEMGNLLLEPSTAETIKKMMGLTVIRGTVRKSFRGWRRDRVLKNLTLGGKTGSLSSKDLRGEHDWFVGFAQNNEKSLVVSAVIVNHPLWHIKPSYLAKHAFINYFSNR